MASNSQKTQHIALVIADYLPHGGIQRVFYHVAELLKKSGHRVTLIADKFHEPLANFDCITLAVKARSNHARMWAISHALLDFQKTERGQAIDYYLGFNKLLGLDGLYTGDLCYAEDFKTRRFAWIKAKLPRYRQYLALEKAALTHARLQSFFLITEIEALRFKRHYPSMTDKTTVLPPAIELERLQVRDGKTTVEYQRTCRNALQARHDLPKNVPYLSIVASKFKTKGVDRILHALSFANRQNVRPVLLVIGDDDPGAYQMLARALKVDHQVYFVGAHEDLAEYYYGTDALIHPARMEAAGKTLLEALYCGLPVMTTENCGYHGHIQKAYGSDFVLSMPFSQTAFNERFLDFCTQQGAFSEHGIKERAHFVERANAYLTSTPITGLFETLVGHVLDDLENCKK